VHDGRQGRTGNHSLAQAINNTGTAFSVLSEQFPVEIRAVGVAFAFNLAVTIFGNFAPFVATWLIAQTGDPLSPAYYLMATALLSIMALMAIERRAPR
jgi:MFS transporter, MHS family, proline/betaine transporter